MNDTTAHRMLKELRILRVHALLSTLVIITLAVAAFRPQRLDTVDVLDVQRINVLNDSGTPALVIAGLGRLPGPTFGGKEYPQELSGGRTGASGMIFFNERGDEVGGLTYAGHLEGGGYRAGGGIMFDQFRQDQVVGMQYQDDGTARSAGFHVWDRNADVHIGDLIEILQARRKATGAARDSVEQALREATAGGLGAHRVFLGSENRNAMLGLQDPDGRIRVRLSVDSLGVARLEFLDEAGKVTREVSG